MNNKSEKEEIKGYISFSIDLNKYTDDLYDDMDYEICREVEPIQISIYYDSSLNKSDEISNQIQAIATDANSEVFEAIKQMRAEAYSYYFEDENIGGEEAIFSADLWFCEKGKEVYSNGTYIRNTGVPPSGLKFPLYEIFEDVNYNDFDIEDAVKHYEQGLESLEKKEFDSAIKLFTKAITLDSKLRKAYAKRGEAKSKLEDYQEAINDFSKAIELDPTYTSVYVQLAVCLNKVELFEDSKKYFTEAIKLNPNRISTIDSYAETLIDQNKTDEAIEVLNQGILDNPTEPERGMGIYWLHQKKGHIFFDSNKWEEAIESYLKALEYDPNKAFTHYKLGSSYYNNESYNNSYNSFEIAHEKDSDSKDSYSYYIRGECKRMLDENEQALVEYDLSIEQNNEEHTLHCNKMKGYCYLELKDFSNAVDSFNKGLKDKWSYQNLGKAYFGLSNYEAAVVNFNKVIEIDANYKWAYQEKGKSLFLLKKYQEAEDCFSKVIEIDPNYKWAYHEKGKVFLKLNDHASALKTFEKVIEIDSKYKKVFYDLAFSYQFMGMYEKAIDYYKKLISDGTSAISWKENQNLLLHYNIIAAENKTPPYLKSEEELLKDTSDKFLLEAFLERGKREHYDDEGAFYPEISLMDLNKVIEIDPKSYKAYFFRAKFYFNSDYSKFYSIEKGTEDLKSCLEIKRHTPALIRYAGLISDFDKKLMLITEAIELSPEDAFAWQKCGEILYNNEDYDGALEKFMKSNELESDGWSLQRIAKTYAALKLNDEAIDFYNKAIELVDWYENWMCELSEVYVETKQIDKAESSILKALNHYSIEKYYRQLYKILCLKYPSDDYKSVLSDISDFLDSCYLGWDNDSEKPSDLEYLKIYEKKLIFENKSIFSFFKFLKGETINHFIENGGYVAKLHLLKNQVLNISLDHIKKIISSGNYTELETAVSHHLVSSEMLDEIMDANDNSYLYSYKLLGVCLNPNVTEKQIEKLKSNKYTWVRRKAFSLTKDFTGADLNDKYTVIGLIENENYPEKETEKLKAKLSDLQSKKYTLKANTENVTILETLSSDITDSKDDILEDLINLDAEDDHSFSDYFRDDWYEYGDSEYGIMESSISLSISDEDSEIYFDFQVPEHIPYPRNPAPGSLLLEVESYEAGGWEFSDFELELEFRPEQFEVSTGDYFGQIYAIEYNNEDSFIEDYDQSDGNLTESRGKDTNISFSVMTESGFTELGLEDINEEIREKIETSGKDINEIKRSIFNKYLNVNS